MIQEIITYLILAAVLMIALRKLVLFFSYRQDKCDACAFSANDCKIAKLKQEIRKKHTMSEKFKRNFSK